MVFVNDKNTDVHSVQILFGAFRISYGTISFFCVVDCEYVVRGTGHE